jgi:hypothetical protein
MDKVKSIEVAFPFPVDIPSEAIDLMRRAIKMVCYCNCPGGHVMWPAGEGAKPVYIPLTQEEEKRRGPELDDSIYYFEVCCRRE